MPGCVGFELAESRCRALFPSGANRKRIRTAELGNRDKRATRRPLIPEAAVSGSDSPDRNRQNPAESREFLDLNSDVSGESLPTQTQWRWGKSRVNSSLR